MSEVTKGYRTTPPAETSPAPALIGPGRHVPALDGLRGLAVVAVVLYHLWPETIPGGWLGVGLFFTLSGFLVIGLLVDDIADGPLDYGRFYRRRVRRLLPAALVTVLVVVVWTASTDDTLRASVANDGFWAVLNLANWNQMNDAGGYAAIFDQTARPLGHMWSLAIEEQFYLTIPLLIGLTRRPAAVVGAGLLLAAVAHAVWWGTPDAYLATPVRIAEILAGGALAIAIRRRPSVAGLGALWPLALVIGVGAVMTVGESDEIVTRGLPAAMSLAWVVLVAVCLTPGFASRALSNPVVRWVGLRSYAIYLIHWPLIELTDWNGPTVIAMTLLLAEASYRVVEDPIRRSRLIVRPLSVLIGASLVAAVGLGVAAGQFDDEDLLVESGFADTLPDWFADDADVLSGALEEAAPSDPVDAVPTTPATEDTGADDTSADTPDPVDGAPAIDDEAAGDPVDDTEDAEPAVPAAPPVVVVLGDSTATQMAAGLRAQGDATRSLAVVDRTTSGCSALIDRLVAYRAYRLSYGYLGEFTFGEPCRVGLDSVDVPADLALIVDHGSVLADHQRPDGTWGSILDEDVRNDVARVYRARIAEAAARRITLALSTAPFIDDPTGLVGEMDDPARLAIYNDLVRELAAEAPGVVVLELGEILDAAAATGEFSRPDGLHLDLAGAETFAQRVLLPALLEVARDRNG